MSRGERILMASLNKQVGDSNKTSVRQPSAHEESGASRIKRDNDDMNKCLTGLKTADRLTLQMADYVSCGQILQLVTPTTLTVTERHGRWIVNTKKACCLLFTEVILKKSDQVTTLSTRTSRMSVGSKNLNVDADVLFN
jgi:hypothetical protein